jgi:hypothetical protein
MLDASRIARCLLALALGNAGCATEEEAPVGAIGAEATSTGGADGLAPTYETGGDRSISGGGAAPTGAGGAASGGATTSGVGGSVSRSSGGGSIGTPASGGARSSGGTTGSASGAGGTGGAAFDLCALFPCAGGMAGTTGAGGTAGAGGDLGMAGANSCDNLFCFDIFDCAIFHFDKLSCNFTKCDGFICKP